MTSLMFACTELTHHACQFQLHELVERCESMLTSMVRVDNCVYLYEQASQLSLDNLAEQSSMLITRHWDSLELINFARVSNDFLRTLFMHKSSFPLHKAIRITNVQLVQRIVQDLHASQLQAKVNEQDNLGETPLHIALSKSVFDIAECLIQHGANIDCGNAKRESLLYSSIVHRRFDAAKFLIEHGASLQAAAHQDGLLHLCADNLEDDHHVHQIASLLIDKQIDINYENDLRQTGKLWLYFARF